MGSRRVPRRLSRKQPRREAREDVARAGRSPAPLSMPSHAACSPSGEAIQVTWDLSTITAFNAFAASASALPGWPGKARARAGEGGEFAGCGVRTTGEEGEKPESRRLAIQAYRVGVENGGKA